VAKQLDLQTLTITGQVYGTPMYMAPEQLTDSKRVDGRCDLYSLGAVLFECLTGKPPFAAQNAVALAFAVVYGPMPELGPMRPDAPRPLVDVVTRCMQKRARERFADARALCAALSAAR
jgi:serine/threonine protein kinase